MFYNNYPNQYSSYLSQQQNNNPITWVQGEAGAKAYPVGAGSSMLLMDSESETFFIKATDISGMPQPLRKFKYQEITESQNTVIPNMTQHFDSSQYITRDEFEKRLSELNKKRTLLKKEEEKDGKSLI